ncbi:TIM44-like domain-containing protein [Terrihabitans rhizophilus]|uniref:TIM44-like domain-containing protein n=1 Tax=Terrihabitans rhizophilus TaxID=3092662 RepID=A0ABU4RT25_9HYPH|nr:TIM44-like domain-containing protein [Terrihabitans sp. PJ23]MDX6807303.1 TIM44-like domain-containing protein [Terrihabitans sp. PJ23]
MNRKLVRLLSLVATSAMLSLAAVDYADARAGGGRSFGSRGSRTFQAPPATPTAPRAAAPMERSATQPGAATSVPRTGAAAGAQATRGRFGGGFAGGLLGGLVGAGLFGMLMGHGFMGGFSGFASIFGLLLQIGIIFLVVRLVMGWFRNRSAKPAMAAAGGPAAGAQGGPQPGPFGMNRMSSGTGFGSATAAPATEDFQVTAADQEAFGEALVEIQTAYGREDISALRTRLTPEMVTNFSDDLADNASQGVINEISDVTLLQGDVAEAWRENGAEYASAAMRFSMRDVFRDRQTGALKEGEQEAPVEATEVWTFRRAPGGRWLLAAIQQA